MITVGIVATIILNIQDEGVTLKYETKPRSFNPKWMNPRMGGNVFFNEILICDSYKQRFIEQAEKGELIPIVTEKDCPPNTSVMD